MEEEEEGEGAGHVGGREDGRRRKSGRRQQPVSSTLLIQGKSATTHLLLSLVYSILFSTCMLTLPPLNLALS